MSSNLNAKKATKISLFNFSTAAMRAFHMSWLAFFVCFFAWFACAPLMPVIAGEFHLTKDQIANINIAAVAITILVRLIVGPLCDKYGPRKTYTALLIIGSLPVFGVASANSYESFLFFRLLIGAIGASFVITQYHTSIMFASNVVGTANAATAGWGNAGGGATQALMPLLLAALVMFGVEQTLGWRIALIVPGVMMLIVGALYWKFTQDCPQGNFKELRAAGVQVGSEKKVAWRFCCMRHVTIGSGFYLGPMQPVSELKSSYITLWRCITSNTSASALKKPVWQQAYLACWHYLRVLWAALYLIRWQLKKDWMDVLKCCSP